MFVFRLAWRNLWRNWKRTAICLSAASLTTAVLIGWYGLVMGLTDQLVYTVVNLGAGEAQVHAPGYLSQRTLYKTVANSDAVMAAARREGIAASARNIGPALASRGSKSAGVQLVGVLPEDERSVSKLSTHLGAGTFLSDSAQKQLVLGSKLAKSLDAGVGSEVVLVVQAADGSTESDIFRVAGVLDSVGETTDRGTAYVHRSDVDALFGLDGKVHEIALSSRGAKTLDTVAAAVANAAQGDDVRTWKQLFPALAEMMSFFVAFTWVMIGIFFTAAALGIVNALLMASFERIPEFGLVKALGASPGRIVREVAAEGALLGIAASLIGGGLGLAFGWYAQKYGLDVSSFGKFKLAGISSHALWYARLSVDVVLRPIVMMWVVSTIASLYPAIKAARLDPIQSLTHH